MFSPHSRLFTVVLGLALLAGLCSIGTPSAFAADPGGISFDEISKTDAARFYIAKQYDKALTAFQTLETEHPRSTLIKRYVASLYDLLHKWDLAASKLKEVLAIDPEDYTARQLLAEVYVKLGQLDAAADELSYIAEHSKTKTLVEKTTRRLNEIKAVKSSALSSGGKTMAIEDFMKSDAAAAFSKADYKTALAGFQQLAAQYPEDVLVKRFHGITLLRIGKDQEAVSVFQKGLSLEPDNAALHYFLANAYLENNMPQESRKEYQWVIAHDKAAYKIRSQREIFKTLTPSKKKTKRWTLSAGQTYEYDTNATYKSNDRSFTQAGDQNSSRFNTTVSGTYRIYQKGKWSVTGDGIYLQSLYTDFPNLQTYTPGAGISALYAFKAFGKTAALNLREGSTVTYLKNKFFVWTNTVSPTFILITSKNTRLSVGYRFSYSEYDNDGSAPDTTSRDGFGNAFSLTNTFYLNDKRNLYLTLGYEFGRDDTEGVNYIRNVHTARTGLHVPLIEKIEADIDFRFKDADHIEYDSRPHRRDDQFNLLVTLTRPLIQDLLDISAFYNFDDTRAKNNLYETTKHVFGVKVTAKY